MAHLIFCLRRLVPLGRDEFQAYWRDVHAPLVRARAEAMGIVRYEQGHVRPESDYARMMAARGAPMPFDGVAQLWWRDDALRTPAQKETAQRANAELLQDERRFIDLAASPIFLVDDHPVLALFVASRA